MYSPDGDVMYGPKDYMRNCRTWLENRVGRSVTVSTYDGGVHSVLVDGKTYYILEESGIGFPPGDGPEHKSRIQICPEEGCFLEAHSGKECPW